MPLNICLFDLKKKKRHYKQLTIIVSSGRHRIYFFTFSYLGLNPAAFCFFPFPLDSLFLVSLKFCDNLLKKRNMVFPFLSLMWKNHRIWLVVWRWTTPKNVWRYYLCLLNWYLFICPLVLFSYHVNIKTFVKKTCVSCDASVHKHIFSRNKVAFLA